MPDRRPDKCEACGAALIWAKGTKADGSRGWIPMNKRRVRVYELSEDGLGPPEFLPVERNGKPLLVHLSHFNTCTDPGRFSKGVKP